MLVFAAGLVLASTITSVDRLPAARRRHAAARSRARPVVGARHRVDHGLAAPATGPGSARPSTTPPARSAAPLGVAIVGSITASIYRSHLAGELPAGLPGAAAAAAHDSLGAALQVSGRLGAVGAHVADAARGAFVAAMSRASIVTAVIALMGALVAWRYLPPAPAKSRDVRRPARRPDVVSTVVPTARAHVRRVIPACATASQRMTADYHLAPARLRPRSMTRPRTEASLPHPVLLVWHRR